MVQVSEALPRTGDGLIDLGAWTERLERAYPGLDGAPLQAAGASVAALAEGQKLLERGLLLAELVASLTLDADALMAALLYRARRESAMDEHTIRAHWGDAVADLVEGVESMAKASLLELSNARLLESERQDQVENVKRLLVSMVDDARVAVIKIAERVVVMRQAKHDDAQRQQRISHEAQALFAPLAGRLGIWHLKWELEDLALRYLQPEVYSDIARQLDGRRLEREAQVRRIADELRSLLADHGIQARVVGRAKHIYSIWRKMQAKNVSLDEVYDVRAVRILVDDLAACYASLGVVHNRFKHVPMEFDDYIAAPKDNGYRSIHTAVIGPDGKTLEVQIRTHEMHQEAELGVCAHWGYKGDALADRSYGAKMEWLRQVVEWHDALGGERSLSEELQASFQQERIFVYTPKGHVIDLPSGAMPLDFAYRVHTDVGHRCVGAVVDGQVVRLSTPLRNGQRVQIDTDPAHVPERGWLEPHPVYVRTNRARSKIQGWLRARGAERNAADGQSLLTAACRAMALAPPDASELGMLAAAFGLADAATLHERLGSGDLQLEVVIGRWCAHFDALQTRLDLPGSTGPSPVHTVVLVGSNREGLLLDTSRLLADLGVSLNGLQGRVLPDGDAELTLDFAAPRLIDVYRLLVQLSAMDGIVRVSRVD